MEALIQTSSSFNMSNCCDNEALQACEAWRIRGNEAYEKGDMVKADKYYTLGVNCVSPSQTLGTTTGDSSGRFDALVFCYGKRADLRLSQGDLRGAIRDCVVGTELDPSCLNLYITAGNSHLLLGEVEAAVEYFSKCTGSGDQVYLDRRIIVASSEGLQKAQRVEEYTTRCKELMQHKTSTSTANALSMIDEALSISSFSEKLLQVKGKALFRLQKYGRVIQLCEQTLDFAEMNFPMVTVPSTADGSQYNRQVPVKLWRWSLMSKAYFRLGRLDMALEVLKEEELLRNRSNQGSSVLFSVTVQEILRHQEEFGIPENFEEKKALRKRLFHSFLDSGPRRFIVRILRIPTGDEAFNAKRYAKSAEDYTAALSKSIGSRPVTVTCFCKRAAARLALGLIADAIADCNVAIALNGNYCEAIFVRATLFEIIRNYGEAASDLAGLTSALENQPEDVQISGALNACSVSDVRELQRAARTLLLSVEVKARTRTFLDLYAILGVKLSDTSDEIRRVFREAILSHHPDKVVGKFLTESGDDGQLRKEIFDEMRKNADTLFKMIAEANEILSDPAKKSEYDSQEQQRKAEECERNQEQQRKAEECERNQERNDKDSCKEREPQNKPRESGDGNFCSKVEVAKAPASCWLQCWLQCWCA